LASQADKISVKNTINGLKSQKNVTILAVESSHKSAKQASVESMIERAVLHLSKA